MISILPIDLSAFGKNPFGKNIWRVVWGPTRTYKAGMKSDSGQVQVHELPLYPGTKAWVLERWLPAIRYAGTKEAWELQERTNDVNLGPYPSEGEWCGCSEIWSEIPGQMNVEFAINKIRAGEDYSFEDHRHANLAVHEKQEADWLNRAMDIYQDSQGSFNNRMTNLTPGKKTPDKVSLKQVDPKKLPKGDGKFFQS